MKLKISKSQWEAMGKKAGWMKTAQINFDKIRTVVAILNGIRQALDKHMPYVNMTDLLAQQEGLPEELKEFRARLQNILKPCIVELSALKDELENN